MERIRRTDKNLRAVARRDRWTADDAKVVLGALDRSGMPIPEFCRKNKMNYHRVQQWHRKRRSGDGRFAAEAMLLPLKIVENIDSEEENRKSDGSWAVEIELGGCRIRVAEGASEAVMSRATRGQ